MTNETFHNIIYLLCNAVLIYAKFKAIYIFSKECKVSKKIEVALFFVYFVINSSLYFIFRNPNVNLINGIILFFALTFNYKSSITKKIIATFLITAVSLFIESIVYYIMSAIMSDPTNTLIVVMIISRVIFYFGVVLLNNLKNIKINDTISFGYIFLISSVSACSIYISVVIMNDWLRSNSLHIIICIALLLFINVSIIFIYDMLNKKHIEEFEKQLLERQNNFYIKQIETMNNAQNNTKIWEHDIKNYFISLKSVSHDKNQVNEYIDNFIKLIETPNKYANSGNAAVDGILNYKIQEAKDMKIDTELELKIPTQLNIKPFDLGIILGNLLDNAIEAASKINENKKIQINIYFEKDILCINVVNTFNGNVIVKEGKYKTTNINKINHGSGLISVNNILGKYNGGIDISNTDTLFTVKIMIYNTTK